MDGRPGDLGEFCWMDVKARDPEGTAGFLARALGWEVEGRRISARGRAIGGLSDLANPVYPPGTPPHVAYYIAVDRIDERVAAAVSDGARVVLDPFDVAGTGRIATLVDPVGAAFSLWEGADGWRGDGVLSGMVLGCIRPSVARRFYRDVLGVPLRCAEFRREDVVAPRWDVLVRSSQGGGQVVSPEGHYFRIAQGGA